MQPNSLSSSAPSTAPRRALDPPMKTKASMDTKTALDLIQQMPKMTNVKSITSDIKNALSAAASDLKEEIRGVAEVIQIWDLQTVVTYHTGHLIDMHCKIQ